jgi:hypothetical protein
MGTGQVITTTGVLTYPLHGKIKNPASGADSDGDPKFVQLDVRSHRSPPWPEDLETPSYRSFPVGLVRKLNHAT